MIMQTATQGRAVYKPSQLQASKVVSTLAQAMETHGEHAAHAEGSFFFCAGEVARGVYMLRKGRAKLTMESAEGKTLTLKIAKPGDLLDLSASVLCKPHEVTAQAMEPCEVHFLTHQDFMRFIQAQGALCLEVALTLGRDLHDACVEMTMLGLSRSADSKIAQLLLRMLEEAGSPNTLKLTSTHEELAELVGTSRETVTRVLSRLRRSKTIEIEGNTLVVRDLEALRSLETVEHYAVPSASLPMRPAMGRMAAAYAS